MHLCSNITVCKTKSVNLKKIIYQIRSKKKYFSSFNILNLITICKSWGSCSISNSFTSFFQLSRRFVTNFWGNGFVLKNLVPDVALKKFALSIFHTLSVNSYVFSNRAFCYGVTKSLTPLITKNCYVNTIFFIFFLILLIIIFRVSKFQILPIPFARWCETEIKRRRIQKMWRRLKIRDKNCNEKETNTTKESVWRKLQKSNRYCCISDTYVTHE